MPATRTPISNAHLPGVVAERTIRQGSELRRVCVYRADEYLGEIVYVQRRRAGGSEYGWRPAKAAPQSKLTDQVGAVRRLPRFAAA